MGLSTSQSRLLGLTGRKNETEVKTGADRIKTEPLIDIEYKPQSLKLQRNFKK